MTNFTWELPFGRSLQGVPALFGRGWELAGIAQMRSGNPLTVFVRANRSRSQRAPSLGPGIGNYRASMAQWAGRMRARFWADRRRWFDPTAFCVWTRGTFGPSGRGAFIGPNLRTVDLSLMKNFRIAERANIQFRAEAFNLLNRANFGVPNLIGNMHVKQPNAPLHVRAHSFYSNSSIATDTTRFAYILLDDDLDLLCSRRCSLLGDART